MQLLRNSNSKRQFFFLTEDCSRIQKKLEQQPPLDCYVSCFSNDLGLINAAFCSRCVCSTSGGNRAPCNRLSRLNFPTTSTFWRTRKPSSASAGTSTAQQRSACTTPRTTNSKWMRRRSTCEGTSQVPPHLKGGQRLVHEPAATARAVTRSGRSQHRKPRDRCSELRQDGLPGNQIYHLWRKVVRQLVSSWPCPRLARVGRATGPRWAVQVACTSVYC